MNSLFKKILYFAFVLFAFFCFTDNTYAISFKRLNEYKFNYDDNFNPLALTKTRDIMKVVAENGTYAYCANRNADFAAGTTFTEDNTYRSSNGCTYYVPSGNDWIKKTGGDCSKIVGYVIAAGNAQDGTNPGTRWYWAQTALWTYLGKFAATGTGFEVGNTSSAQAYDNNGTIQNIIKTAWRKYAEDINTMPTEVSANLINVTWPSDLKLRYNSASCGGGSYITSPIEITNISQKAIEVSIPVPHDAVSVCIVGGSCVSHGSSSAVLTYTLPKNQTLSVYLSASSIFSGNVPLSITASYNETGSVSKTTYDSRRYGAGSYQAMIVPEVISASSSITKIHKEIEENVFSQVPINHYDCGNSSDTIVGNTTVYSSNTTSNPVSKVCANNASVDEATGEANPGEYTVQFSGCSCESIDLGNGRKVSVLLKENSSFRFGTLNPTSVYPGGGFKLFDTADRDAGLTGVSTLYQSYIKWEYADFVRSSSGNDLYPYYYNPSNLSNDDARLIESEIVEKIKEKFNDKIDLNFSSKDSNDEKDTSMKIIPVSLDLGSVSYDNSNKIYSFRAEDIELTHSYFSVDGLVSYAGQSATYSIDGGNKYYIPLRYLNTTFPFNIGLTNLSSLQSGRFYYIADCDVDVDVDNYLYGDDGIAYRSINLDNPFPKASTREDIAFNWRSWYYDSETNKNRLKNTFQNYPSQPLYLITMNSNRLGVIRGLTDSYSSWSNIKTDGSSSFITANGYFDVSASNSSYCKISEFSNSCDR